MIKKIHVTGNAGSGKTSFAKALSKKLQIESHGLDQIVWKPGWVKTSSEEKFAKIQALIEKDAWVIEGVSSQVFRAADTIIFLDLPIWKCIFSIIQRSFMNGPGTRKELPQNCPEIIGIFKAIKIAFVYQKETRPLLLNLASKFKLEKKIYFVKSRKNAEHFLMHQQL